MHHASRIIHHTSYITLQDQKWALCERFVNKDKYGTPKLDVGYAKVVIMIIVIIVIVISLVIIIVMTVIMIIIIIIIILIIIIIIIIINIIVMIIRSLRSSLSIITLHIVAV